MDSPTPPPVFVSGIELLRTFFARSAKIFFFAKKKEIGRGILKFFGENGIFSDKYGSIFWPKMGPTYKQPGSYFQKI